MKRNAFVSCFLLLLLTGCQKGTSSGSTDLFSFEVFEHSASVEENRASVFAFLAPDCPLSQNYTRTLKALHAQFTPEAVGFYGIVPGDFFENEVDDFISKYEIGFPVLLDRDFDLVEFFDATVTPEVFMVDSGRTILYKGAIDNWAAALGQHRTVITEHYLLDALNSLIQDTGIQVRDTQAVGCFIERRSVSEFQRPEN